MDLFEKSLNVLDDPSTYLKHGDEATLTWKTR